MHTPESANSRRRGGAWVVLGRGGGAALALLANVLLARMLPVEQMGEFVLATSIIAFFGMMARFGLDKSLVRFVAEAMALESPNRIRGTFRQATTILAVSLALWLIAVPMLLTFLRLTQGVALAPVMIGAVVLGFATAAILQMVAESFRGFHDHRRATLFDGQASSPIVNGLFVVVLLACAGVAGLDATRAVWLYVGVVLAVAAVGVRQLIGAVRHTLRQMPVTHPTKTEELPRLALLWVCVPLFLIQATAYWGVQGDILIAGNLLTEHDVGLLGVARRLVQTISLPLVMISAVVLPSIPRLSVLGRIEELELLLQRNATLAAIPSIAALVLLIAVPGPLLSLLFGEKYAAASHYLIILAIGQAFATFTGASGQLLVLTGRERIVLVVELASAALLLVGGYLAARSYGLLGLVIVSNAVLTMKYLSYWGLARILIGIWTHARLSLIRASLQEVRTLLGRSSRPVAPEASS
jgi:O-antigen/teichoic acid export membrane protein